MTLNVYIHGCVMSGSSFQIQMSNFPTLLPDAQTIIHSSIHRTLSHQEPSDPHSGGSGDTVIASRSHGAKTKRMLNGGESHVSFDAMLPRQRPSWQEGKGVPPTVMPEGSDEALILASNHSSVQVGEFRFFGLSQCAYFGARVTGILIGEISIFLLFHLLVFLQDSCVPFLLSLSFS